VADQDLRTDYLRLKAALYDPNTDVYALPAVADPVRGLFEIARWVGVIHVEIDSITRVETIYGWQVLDGLLREIAEVLRQVRSEILPREALLAEAGIYGGRFFVFTPLASASVAPMDAIDRAANVLAGRLRDRFSSPEFESMSPPPAFHVGYAAFTNQPFFRLERLVYRAVEDARALSLRDEPRQRSREQAELRRIILDGDIDVVYQPVVDVKTSEVLGYEALSRGPRDTIFEKPMAMFSCSQEAGMARDLDLLCQRRALDGARRLARGKKLFMNTLPASLLDPAFRDHLLLDLPHDLPASPEDIVIEIADRDAIGDYDLFGQEIAELRSRGFRFAVDDVGTGSGTLHTIAEIRPDYIKIDGSLIRDAQTSLVKQEMLRSLSQVAHSIEAVVVAEGIESETELEVVKQCGIEYGQGFLFARPGPGPPAVPGEG
jgi:EAL domain-containing protein (putative c-di-GMP-specific phosphodiesterase class I)